MDELDLEERVRRLERTVAELQLRLGENAPARTDLVEAAPAPGRTAAPRDLESLAFTYWLSRLGVLALITGIAWFIVLHFGEVGALARMALGYGLCAALTGAGFWFSRSSPRFGHVVIGGGLSVGYFVTYALHFVSAIRVIDSQLLALALLACCVIAIVVVAQRLGSETIAGIALFLGFHTSFLGDAHVLTLVSTTLLALAAVYLMLKNRWILVPLGSLAAVYIGHAIGSVHDAPAHPTRADTLVALGFALVYFLVFAVAMLARPQHQSRAIGLGFTLGNALGFLAIGTGACLSYDRPLLLPFLLLASLLFLGSAARAYRKHALPLAEANLGLAVVVFAWALGEALPPWARGVSWAALGLATAHLAVRTRRTALGIVGASTLIAALLAIAIAGGSALAYLALAAALVGMVQTAHESPHEPLPRGLRITGASGAALATMLAASTLVPWTYCALGWAVAAVMLVGLGIVLRERALRFAGLGVLGLAAGKLLVFDLARLPTDQRILTFVASGVLLLGVSFAYTRFKDSLQRLL